MTKESFLENKTNCKYIKLMKMEISYSRAGAWCLSCSAFSDLAGGSLQHFKVPRALMVPVTEGIPGGYDSMGNHIGKK